jgi:hypothetical protein
MGPVLTAMRWIAPSFVLTTEQIGQAMLAVARHGAPTRVLEAGDVAAAARGAEPRIVSRGVRGEHGDTPIDSVTRASWHNSVASVPWQISRECAS